MESSRIELLIAKFPSAISQFTERPPFARDGQLRNHLQTVKLRRELGSADAAISNEEYIESLYRTLLAWGIGARASKIASLGKFAEAIRGSRVKICELDGYSIGDVGSNRGALAAKLWDLIESLHIVENDAPLVSGTKALHHILPDLVVPIDRAYTQKFFGWHNPQFQYGQEKCFKSAFEGFCHIANKVPLEIYADTSWNSSITKIIDNAVVGFSLTTNN